MKIRIHELTHRFEGNLLFDALNFSFEEGQFYFLKGGSGSGKSTLLKMIVNLYKPDSGKIEFSQDMDIILLRQKVQLLPQLPVMIPGTVEDNLLWPFSLPVNQDKKPSTTKIESTLSTLFPEGMSLAKDAEKLSHGQKQRLAVGRVLLLNPEVLLCDEPTSALDPQSRKIVEAEINKFFKSRPDNIVIYISHHEDDFKESGHFQTVYLSSEGIKVS